MREQRGAKGDTLALRAARRTSYRRPVKSSEEALRSLVDSIPEPAWTARADGFADFFNRRWLDYTGTTIDEMKGWGWKSVHHPLRVSSVEERMKRAMLAGEAVEMEVSLRGADGVFRDFHTRVVPMRDGRGKVIRWFGTNTRLDELNRVKLALVTAAENETRARIETEAALASAARLFENAARAVRAREEVLAIVSHDLRNPLSTVLMGASNISSIAPDTADGARIQKVCTTITKAVGRMNRLINDLLDVSKLEEGIPLFVELRRQDAIALVRESVELFEPVVTGRRLSLVVEELPGETIVLCDAERVQQALSNLLGNAVKFTREGGTIRVGARRTETELEIVVGDTGIGISAEHLPHIFTTYWQADTGRKRGAGLGLAIVKAVAESHGGRVNVETEVDVGSTFVFTLPLAPRDPRKDGDAGHS